MHDPLQPLHDDLRALDARLAGAQRTLHAKAGTERLDRFKSFLALLAAVGLSTCSDVFPSTEDTSLDLLHAQRIAIAMRSTGAALAARGLLPQGVVDATADLVEQTLDHFPHEEHMSHCGFANWTDRVKVLRRRCAELRREVDQRPVGYRA